MKKSPLLATLFLLCGSAFADTSETVFTLSDNLQTATKYYSKRSDTAGTYSFLFPKNFDKTRITYARPENYSWTTGRNGNTTLPSLKFSNTTSYAYLERLTNKNDFLEKDKSNPNRYILSVDGSECIGDNCTQTESIISTIIPSRFVVLNYGASVDETWFDKEHGKWKVVDGTYTFYRSNLKGAIAKFLLEDGASFGYSKLVQTFEKNKEIEVNNEGNRIRVVMPIEQLFDSGSAQMKNAGLEWIKKLSSSVTSFNFVELRVEGHTDSTPIAKKTREGYSSNWELSSARASNIVQLLISRGIPAGKLAAVGYADSKPIATNDTNEGKAKNRRIEFSIVISEKTATAAE